MDRYVDCGFRIVDCLCGLGGPSFLAQLWCWMWQRGSFLVDQKSLNARNVLLLGQKGLNWISFPRVNNYVMRGSQRWSQPRATILSLTQRSSLLPCLSFCSCYPIWKNSTHRCARLVFLALVVLLLSLVLFASLELLTSLALNAWLVGITCITYITCITCITCIREATKKSWYFLGIFPK